MIKIRLFYAKLLIEERDYLGAKYLLFDNIRDCQVEIMVRSTTETRATSSDPKIMKSVASHDTSVENVHHIYPNPREYLLSRE